MEGRERETIVARLRRLWRLPYAPAPPTVSTLAGRASPSCSAQAPGAGTTHDTDSYESNYCGGAHDVQRADVLGLVARTFTREGEPMSAWRLPAVLFLWHWVVEVGALHSHSAHLCARTTRATQPARKSQNTEYRIQKTAPNRTKDTLRAYARMCACVAAAWEILSLSSCLSASLTLCLSVSLPPFRPFRPCLSSLAYIAHGV